jgi:hypothetical protein
MNRGIFAQRILPENNRDHSNAFFFEDEKEIAGIFESQLMPRRSEVYDPEFDYRKTLQGEFNRHITWNFRNESEEIGKHGDDFCADN